MTNENELRELTPSEKAILHHLIGAVSGQPELTAQAKLAKVRGTADEFGGIFLAIPQDSPRAAITGGKLVAEGYWYKPPHRIWLYLWSDNGRLYSIEVLPGEAGTLSDIDDIAQVELTSNL